MIRQATLDDLQSLVNLALASMEENDVADFGCPISIPKLTESISLRIQYELVFVAETTDREIVGCYVASRSATLYSDRVCILSDIFYIKPEFRTFYLAKAFISIMKECAILNRSPIVFDLFAQKDVDKKKKLLKYLGFKDFGSSLVFKVENTNE